MYILSVECEAGIVEVKHCHHHHVCPCTLPGSLSYKHGLRCTLRKESWINSSDEKGRAVKCDLARSELTSKLFDELMRSHHSTWTFVVGSFFRIIIILYCWVYCSKGDWLWRKLLSSLWGGTTRPTALRQTYSMQASTHRQSFVSTESHTHRTVSQLHHLSPNIFPGGRCWEWKSSICVDTGTDGSTQRLSTWLERFGLEWVNSHYIRLRPALQTSCSELHIIWSS